MTSRRRKQAKQNKSATPALIILGSIVFSIGMANPVPFFFALLFVWIFSNKL